MKSRSSLPIIIIYILFALLNHKVNTCNIIYDISLFNLLNLELFLKFLYFRSQITKKMNFSHKIILLIAEF